MSIIKRFMGTKLVWRLSGISFWTATIATTGSRMSIDDYINSSKASISQFLKYLQTDKIVLEFGCGLGRNLFAISDKIKYGYGIDINPLYIRLAKKIAKKYSFGNLNFFLYDGNNFPEEVPSADVILELNVFERLDKSSVEKCVLNLIAHLKPNGVVILFFLTDRAKGTEFTKRLGDSAYVFWSNDEIEKLLRRVKLDTKELITVGVANIYVCEYPTLEQK